MLLKITATLRRIRGDLEMSVRESFRLYSQKLNAFATLFLLPYIIASNGGFIASLVERLPEGYRIVLAPFVGAIAFGIVTWARLRVQKPKV